MLSGGLCNNLLEEEGLHLLLWICVWVIGELCREIREVFARKTLRVLSPQTKTALQAELCLLFANGATQFKILHQSMSTVLQVRQRGFITAMEKSGTKCLT